MTFWDCCDDEGCRCQRGSCYGSNGRASEALEPHRCDECPPHHEHRQQERRETVRRIVKACTDELDALNYGLLSLQITEAMERYLDNHYPLEADDAAE